MPKGLYANINKRKKAGTSRSKAKSTIKPSVYKAMKSKTSNKMKVATKDIKNTLCSSTMLQHCA